MGTAGRAAGRSPAGFAQVAAALKARRAELAARQKALAAEQQAPPTAGTGSAKGTPASKHAHAAPASSQPQLPDEPVQPASAMKQAPAGAFEPYGSQAAEQLDADVADAVPNISNELGSSAGRVSQPQSTPGAGQLQDSGAGVTKQSHGVKTRSAARQQEHVTIPSALESSQGTQPSPQPGSVVKAPQQVNPFFSL